MAAPDTTTSTGVECARFRLRHRGGTDAQHRDQRHAHRQGAHRTCGSPGVADGVDDGHRRRDSPADPARQPAQDGSHQADECRYEHRTRDQNGQVRQHTPGQPGGEPPRGCPDRQQAGPGDAEDAREAEGEHPTPGSERAVGDLTADHGSERRLGSGSERRRQHGSSGGGHPGDERHEESHQAGQPSREVDRARRQVHRLDREQADGDPGQRSDGRGEDAEEHPFPDRGHEHLPALGSHAPQQSEITAALRQHDPERVRDDQPCDHECNDGEPGEEAAEHVNAVGQGGDRVVALKAGRRARPGAAGRGVAGTATGSRRQRQESRTEADSEQDGQPGGDIASPVVPPGLPHHGAHQILPVRCTALTTEPTVGSRSSPLSLPSASSTARSE